MKALVAFLALAVATLILGQNAPPLGTITARVTDEVGAPIPGVRLSVSGPGGITTGLTDEKGSAVLRVGAGANNVTAALQGFSTQIAVVVVKDSENSPIALTLRVAGLAPSPFERDRDVDLQADNVQIQGNTVLYRGHVRMKTDSVEVQADEIDFNTVTRTANARGNVTIQVLRIVPRVVPLWHGQD
jgi:Carboxypeptidase regulatory-like domain